MELAAEVIKAMDSLRKSLPELSGYAVIAVIPDGPDNYDLKVRFSGNLGPLSRGLEIALEQVRDEIASNKHLKRVV